MCQAEHTPLHVWLLDEAGETAKLWLTIIEDDCSRALVSLQPSFQESSVLTTALAFQQTIWHKEEPYSMSVESYLLQPLW